MTSLEELRRHAVETGEIVSGAMALRGQLTVPPENHKRDFRRYTAAQTNEKAAFRLLLRELGLTLPVDGQVMGRRRVPLADMVFAMVYKSYVGLSGRRFMTDLSDLHRAGFISTKPCANSISNYLADASLTPILQSLVQGIAASFAHIETSFAVDATGFRIPRVTKWRDEKYGFRERREWLKCHASVGVKTHIVAAVEITKRNVMDHARFRPLVSETARQFDVREVSADSAYSIIANLEHVDALNAVAAIPFKANANPFIHSPNSVWYRLFHVCALNGDDWQRAVNQQNQAESAFSMIKRKFGEKVFGKTDTAQINEILCKIICHNLCTVIYWLYEFGLDAAEIPSGEHYKFKLLKP